MFMPIAYREPSRPAVGLPDGSGDPLKEDERCESVLIIRGEPVGSWPSTCVAFNLCFLDQTKIAFLHSHFSIFLYAFGLSLFSKFL